MKTSVFVGLDVGASSATAVAVDEAGDIVAACRSLPPVTSEDPAADLRLTRLARVLEEITADVGRDWIAGLMVGMAGVDARPELRAEVAQVARRAGIVVEPRVLHDAVVMLASGSATVTGHVLATGTGAVALSLREGRTVRRVDGNGWLLGDAGSAAWIGLAAVRAVLATLDGRAESTSLADAVPKAVADLAGSTFDGSPMTLVQAAGGLGAQQIGRLAAVVDEHARAGDSAARRIIGDAGRELGRTLGAAVGDDDRLPIVLGGSVIYANAAIRSRLLRLAARRWPSAPLSVVPHGAVGAALMARRDAGISYDDQVLSALSRSVANRLDPA